MSSTEDGRYGASDGGSGAEREGRDLPGRDLPGRDGAHTGEAGQTATGHGERIGTAGRRTGHPRAESPRAESPRRERRGGRRQRSANGPAPGRPPGRTTYRRALRREAPTVVGMLLGSRDFTAMTGYPSFVLDDYDRYLQHLDELLRDLYDRGTHVAVALFDPEGYADYCRSTRQPPDAPRTRTRYVAEAAVTGAAVRYTRQPMSRLRAELAREADRRATWERASDLLIAAGPCPECGDDLACCAFDRASHTLLRLIQALGPGRHHAVCSLSPDDGGPALLAALLIKAPPPPPSPAPPPPGDGRRQSSTGTGSAADGGGGAEGTSGDREGDGDLRFSEPDALVLCTVLAAATVTARPAGLVIRTTAPHEQAKTAATTEQREQTEQMEPRTQTQADTGTETVRGWTAHRGELRPLSEAEVFSAYCTDPATGEPVPPEPGVRYRAGLPLPPPLHGDTR